MGLYDREYYRRDRPTFSLNGPRTMVGTLVLINAVFYLANALFTPPHGPFDEGRITEILAATPAVLTQPLLWWKLLTYGFAHAHQPQHIILNMLGLFFLGGGIEERYGRGEFLRIYLMSLLAGSLAWAIANRLQGHGGLLIGASGGVAAIVVLYALNYPHRTILLFFFLPVPAWFAGLLLVATDLYGSLTRADAHVAYSVHLAGAAFALAYFKLGWNFGRLIPSRLALPRFGRPRLRVHNPEEAEEDDSESLAAEVDRILEKISREGEQSLTRRERKTLESASREYQRRRRGDD